MSPFSWQGQNLYGLSLSFIIDRTVVCSLKGCHVGQRYHYSAGLACSLCLKDFTVFELARLFNIEAIWASSGERSSPLCMTWHASRVEGSGIPEPELKVNTFPTTSVCIDSLPLVPASTNYCRIQAWSCENKLFFGSSLNSSGSTTFETPLKKNSTNNTLFQRLFLRLKMRCKASNWFKINNWGVKICK